jgi:hypothetical protein
MEGFAGKETEANLSAKSKERLHKIGGGVKR